MSRLTVYGRTGTFTWRMLATVLLAQSVLIFFGALVARGLAIAGDDAARAQRLLWFGSGIAVLAIVAAALMRRSPLAVALGWVVQVLTWAAALIVTSMVVVGLVFTGLWVYSLVKGGQADDLVAERARTGSVAADPAPEA